MKKMIMLAIVPVASVFWGCQEIESVLNISEKGLQVVVGGKVVQIPEGQHPILIKISDRSDDWDEIYFLNKQSRPFEKIKLKLPSIRRLTEMKDGSMLRAESLHQVFDVSISKDSDPGVEFVGLSFQDPETQKVLATAHFKNKWVEESSDANASFVRQYQSYRRSQRGVLIPIEGGLDRKFNQIVNWVAQLMIAPWIYARYSKVEWAKSFYEQKDQPAYFNEKWSRLILYSPQIDYFAFTHGGDDVSIATYMPKDQKKKNQLRYVYTEGCSSGSAHVFISNYNATMATGHTNTSASPFFSFPLIRAWTYGKSAQDSVNSGWKSGKDSIRALNIFGASAAIAKGVGWKNIDEMMSSSELMISWTREVTPTQLKIGGGAIPLRSEKPTMIIYENFISKMDSAKPVAVSMVLL